MSFIDADNELLKIDLGNGLETVICLTSTGISESISEFIETGDMGTRGEQTFLPRLYGYTIPFSGIAGVESGLISWEDLKEACRNKTQLTWELLASSSEQGTGYIQNLEKVSQAGEFITFSGTIQGRGAIVEDFFYLATSDTDLFDTGIGKLLVA